MMDVSETTLPNDQRDGGWVEADNEWKPRPRHRVIGGIEWLARMSDKARAKAKGTIGAYIYPCPADKRLLTALEIDPDTFQHLAVEAASDEELVEKVRAASPTIKAGSFAFQMRRPQPAQAGPAGSAGQPAQQPGTPAPAGR